MFDTFIGLQELSDDDTHFGKKHWKKNEFNDTSLETVKNYLSSYNNIQIIKGKFPKIMTLVGGFIGTLGLLFIFYDDGSIVPDTELFFLNQPAIE